MKHLYRFNSKMKLLSNRENNEDFEKSEESEEEKTCSKRTERNALPL